MMIEALNQLATYFALFSVNYLIHTTVLVGLVLLACHYQVLAFDRLGEWVLKSVLLMGLITAVVQTSGWLNTAQTAWQTPWQMTWQATTDSPAQKNSQAKQPNQAMSDNTKSTPEAANPNSRTTANHGIMPKAPLEFSPQTKPSETGAKLALAADSEGVDNTRVLSGALIWLLMWVAGTLWLVLKYRHKQQQWQRYINQRTAVTDDKTLKIFARLKRCSGLSADIKVSQVEGLSSPIAWHQEVVCPVEFLQNSSTEQIEAALAHELSHIKRRDGWWLAFSQWHQSLLFFQPLNHLLMKHIHQDTEQRADSMAAGWTENPRALAITLVAVAQAQQPQTHLPMVPAMTSNKSKLMLRVENILQQNPFRTSRLLMVGLLAALALIITTAPGVVAKTTHHQQASKSSYQNIEVDGELTEMSVSHSQNGKQLKLKAKLKGEIELNADESAIVSFPANSRFDLTHSDGGIKQRILIESAPGVNAENAAYTYWYDGDKRSFDARARQWLAEVLPMVWRQTGIQAEARVKRIHGHRGNEGVLAEVALIDSDFVRKSYLTHLFAYAELNDSDLKRAMQLAGEIGSDFELSHVLSALVATQNLSSEALWLAYFEATDSIDSDFEMAKTMLNVLPELPASEAINQAYFKAAESIGSDFEMSKVLMAYLEQQGQADVNVMNLFKLATHIGSDFELAKVMLAANQHLSQKDLSTAVFSAYLDLAAEIGSDFEMKKVYADLLRYDVPAAHLEQMIDAASEHIGSDFELASLLLSITKQPTINDRLKERIKVAAQTIGSQFERNKVLAALI